MSEILPVSSAAPGVNSNASEPVKGKHGGMNRPRSAKLLAFLNKSRSLGAPGFKRLRKRTRIAALEAQVSLLQQILGQAVTTTARGCTIIQELIKEQNFAIDEAQGGQILWVADDESIKKAQAYLDSFNAGTPAPTPPLQSPLPTNSEHA